MLPRSWKEANVFSSSTESKMHKGPASLINLLMLLLFNEKPLVVGFT